MRVIEFWNVKLNEAILGIEIGDINNNGNKEIVGFTRTGALLILSQNGEIIQKKVILKEIPIWHLKIYDLDNDGKNEIILGGMDGVLRTYKCNNSYELTSFWNHKFSSSISGILINDINKNNTSELIVYSLDKTIRILNALDGTLIWGQIFEDGVGTAIVFVDKRKMIIAGGNDGTIRVFNAFDGELLWFKRFSNKVRCVSFMKTSKGSVVLCGGDDKELHFIDIRTQKEFKTIKFKDYVWKCKSYSIPSLNKSLVSSYSFDYFNNSLQLENVNFTSKLICLNESLELNWELKGYNIECLKVIEIFSKIFIIAGTTKGELLIIEEETGSIIYNNTNNESLNKIQFFEEKKILFCCYDNGMIFAYQFIDD
ncbi:MAG: PQQ-binding-like beta-propeller repeat protein [Candidatus Hodarchaeota archaeon]